MIIGIAVLILGIYSAFSEYYEMEELLSKRALKPKESVEKGEYFKVKVSLGGLLITIGVLLILNYFIY